MLTIHKSSDIHPLAEYLSAELNNHPPPNPLSPEWFVVQNHGMAQWLSLYMAEREGIAANLKFKFPAELFWQLLRVTEPGIPENLPSERLPMTWAIFQILSNDTDPSLAELHRYARHTDPQKQEMRRWKLSARIGDVFDQYLTYRPQMLLGWEKGQRETGRSTEKWQVSLWRKLVARWQGEEADESSGGNHRAALQSRLIRALDENRLAKHQLLSRLSVFGVTEMPPVYLNAFLKLSKCTDVHFYMLDITGKPGEELPQSPEEAGGTGKEPMKVGPSGDPAMSADANPLLESLGQAGREFKQLISDTLNEDPAISAQTNRLEARPENDNENGQPGFFRMVKSDLVSVEKADGADTNRSDKKDDAASRSAEEGPETYRSADEPLEAGRSVKKVPEADRSMKENAQAELSFEEAPEADRSADEVPEADRSMKKDAAIDRSVQVHSCHSPRREVEVLYDQMLDLLDEDDSLNPSDILVLSPQMETYAPEIEAVFGAVEEGMPEIPYHLSEAGGTENAVDLGFRKLLHIADSRFRITDVLDLLDCKPVRMAFSFTTEGISALERWMEDVRIRWGIDGAHKGSLGLPESGRFTWQSGLHRMVSGYAMEPEGDRLYNGIYPYQEIQQSEQGELLGHFSHFMHLLFECHDEIRKPKRPEEWRALLNEWASAFFTKEEPFANQLHWLRNRISATADQAAGARFNEAVSFRIMRTIIEDGLDAGRTGGGRSGAGVTFGSMVAMRNIPARVIGLIGMNDGVFPRAKSGVEFDLIAKNPQKGDRSPGKDDRQLFLETLMAAGEKIYFSYVGQSNRKEVDFPPSVILREFIDYLVAEYKVDEKELIQKHRLHAFSPYYFNRGLSDTLFSYSSDNRSVARRLSEPATGDSAFVTGPLPEPDQSLKNLSVGELIAFFQHPAQYMLQQRMGINLHRDAVLDEDREMFGLDALDKYTMGQEMLDRFLGDASVSAYRAVARAQNRLPDGWPGQQAFNRQEQEVREFGALIEQDLAQEEREPVEVDAEIKDFKLAGRLDHIYESEQLLYRFGRMRAKDVIDLWIRHLAFQIAKPENHPGLSRLCTRDRKKPLAAFRLPALSNAPDILGDLLKVYWTGLQENTFFFPDSSFAYAHEILYKDRDEEAALRAVEREWVDTYRGYPKEGDDPYNIRLMGSINPMKNKKIKDLFKIRSISFWETFFDVLNKQDVGPDETA